MFACSDVLKLSEPCPLELLARYGNVGPEAALTTNGAGSLNRETDCVGRFRRTGQVDVIVSTRDVRSAAIGQWEQVNDWRHSREDERVRK